jgi:hypothetical protein
MAFNFIGGLGSGITHTKPQGDLSRIRGSILQPASSVWPDAFVAVTSPAHTENAANKVENPALRGGALINREGSLLRLAMGYHFPCSSERGTLADFPELYRR